MSTDSYNTFYNSAYTTLNLNLLIANAYTNIITRHGELFKKTMQDWLPPFIGVVGFVGAIYLAGFLTSLLGN